MKPLQSREGWVISFLAGKGWIFQFLATHGGGLSYFITQIGIHLYFFDNQSLDANGTVGHTCKFCTHQADINMI